METKQAVATEELFRRFRETQDSEALTEVFDRTSPRLMEVAAHLCRDTNQAEDVLQECFLIAIEKSQRWDARRPLLPWLQGILFREAKKARRRAARSLPPEEAREGIIPDATAPLHNGELRAAVERALSSLPGTYVDVLRRYLLDGRTQGELSQELGRAPGTVRVQLHRGLDLLRRALPAGLAIGVAGPAMPRGLAAVREVVRQKASTAAPAAGIGIGTSLVAFIVMNKKTVLLTIGLLLVGFSVPVVWSATHPSGNVKVQGQAIAALATPPSSPDLQAGERATKRELPVTGAESTSAAVEAIESQGFRIRGRLISADGSEPGSPTVVFVKQGLSPQTEASTLPTAEFGPDSTFQLELDAQVPGHIAVLASGSDTVLMDPWSAKPPPGSSIYDLGDIQLPLGARITGRAFREGMPMRSGTVTAILEHPAAPLEQIVLDMDGGLVRRSADAQIQPDGSFELKGLKQGATYRLAAFPADSEKMRIRALDAVGTAARAPVQGLELDWGMRRVTFAVTSAGKPVPRPGVKPGLGENDTRDKANALLMEGLRLPVYGSPDGRIEALIASDRMQPLEFLAAGHRVHKYTFDPDLVPSGQVIEIAMDSQLDCGILDFRFTGVDQTTLAGTTALLVTLDPERGMEKSPMVPVVEGIASFAAVNPGCWMVGCRLFPPKGVPVQDVYFYPETCGFFFLDTPMEANERRLRDVPVPVGGRFQLELNGTLKSGEEPMFQVLQPGGKKPALDISRVVDSLPKQMSAPRIEEVLWAPGSYVVQWTDRDGKSGSVEVEVRMGETTRARISLGLD